MRRRTLISAVILLLIGFANGCSSLNVTLWPSNFPLIAQAKEMAAKSPLPNGLPHELSKQALQEYFLEAGDRILIEPTSLDSKFKSMGDQKIQVDGSIDLAEFGRIRVTGMTVESVEDAIEERVKAIGGERVAVNVQLIESNAAEVYVLGEVGSPGAYMLDGNETVLDAILRAGGLTSKASPCDMILVRPTDPCACRVVLPICYRQITQMGDVSSNYQLLPGDRIVVGARTFAEELAFWKQSSECDRCCRSHCRQTDPGSVNYKNRFIGLHGSFPLPSPITSSTNKEAQKERSPSIERSSPSGSAGKAAESDDSDVFLTRPLTRKPTTQPSSAKP